MGLFSKWFSHAYIHAFANELANDIAKRYPPALDSQPGKRPSVNRMTRIVEDACKKAQDFQKANRLGWLGKAKLGNTFKWALQEKGYQKDFADFATEALIVYISKKAS
jgi:hypothetical protein